MGVCNELLVLVWMTQDLDSKVLWRFGQVSQVKTDNEREDECKR